MKNSEVGIGVLLWAVFVGVMLIWGVVSFIGFIF